MIKVGDKVWTHRKAGGYMDCDGERIVYDIVWVTDDGKYVNVNAVVRGIENEVTLPVERVEVIA